MSDWLSKFWSKVDRRTPEECWVWKGPFKSRNYGCFCRDGRRLIASRVSWEIHNGPIPDGLLVCHKCDNPPCVNPNHLFLGTTSDNALDSSRKGRNIMQRHPERAHRAKIKEIQTHCLRGHTLTPENITSRPGRRECKHCKRIRSEKRLQRQRVLRSLAETPKEAPWLTLCVECGPNVPTDEDGCCATCGATAIGDWLTNRGARPAPKEEES